MCNIHLYARSEPYEPMVRIGRAYKNIATAKLRAKAMQFIEVEVRDDHLPRSKSLISIFSKGVEIGSII